MKDKKCRIREIASPSLPEIIQIMANKHWYRLAGAHFEPNASLYCETMHYNSLHHSKNRCCCIAISSISTLLVPARAFIGVAAREQTRVQRVRFSVHAGMLHQSSATTPHPATQRREM